MQTPIQKAISYFNDIKAKSNSLNDALFLDDVNAKLQSLLPY